MKQPEETKSSNAVMGFVALALIALIIFFVARAVIGGGDAAEPSNVPNVVGFRLDEALLELNDAGYKDSELGEDIVDAEDDNVNVLGGGIFGILDEDNWEVCSQRPRAGGPADDVTIRVERTGLC